LIALKFFCCVQPIGLLLPRGKVIVIDGVAKKKIASNKKILPDGVIILSANKHEYEPWQRLFWSIRFVMMQIVFAANTLHIVHWRQVFRLFRQIGTLLPQQGIFCSYDFFNSDGIYVSQSKAPVLPVA